MSLLWQKEALKDGLVPYARKRFDRESMVIDTGRESHVQQQFIKECDINNILKRYRATGLMRQLPGQPMYGDFSNIPDYQDALNTVIRAEEAFMRLPSDLRTRFDNDPQKFLDFVKDPANKEELYSLGLAVRPKPSDTDRIVEAVQGLKPDEGDQPQLPISSP